MREVERSLKRLDTDRIDVYLLHSFDATTPIEETIRALDDLVRLLGEMLGREPVVERLPAVPGDVPITFASVTKARERLGYAPTTDIRTGLARFVDWFRNEEGTG